MNQITRIATLGLLCQLLLLSVSPPASAQTSPDRYDYAFCAAIAEKVAGVSRVLVVSPAFVRSPDNKESTFRTVVYQKFGPVREPGCIYARTAKEAEARRQAQIDGMTKSYGPQTVAYFDWIPSGAKALSGATTTPAEKVPGGPPIEEAVAKTPAPQAATPKPAVAIATPPKPPAATKGVFVDCNGIDLGAGKLFFNPPVEVTSGDANAWSASYAQYLLKNYKYDRNIACTKLPTLAEAQRYYEETSDARRGSHDLMGNPAPLVVTSWKYP
jgi:hypothetical protein